MRTRIKICGVTDPNIARVAADAGADAIGLMFHPPSTRHLAFENAAVIRRALPLFVKTVAVMVNPTLEFVRSMIAQVAPDYLQFHGTEDADFCSAFGKPYIKALRVSADTDLARLEARYSSACSILLDTHVTGCDGGSGKVFNWQQANYGANLPLILAGGLTPENVGDAIKQTTPYAVDVSSGVERDGVKVREKIYLFCEKVADCR